MTSKLKCPYCQTELEQMHDKKMLGCPKCLHIADGAFWKKAIQAKQDLEIAHKAFEMIRDEFGIEDRLMTFAGQALTMKAIAEKALKQIEHKE